MNSSQTPDEIEPVKTESIDSSTQSDAAPIETDEATNPEPETLSDRNEFDEVTPTNERSKFKDFILMVKPLVTEAGLKLGDEERNRVYTFKI